MNYTWSGVSNNGEEAIGFIDIYSATVDWKKAYLLINYIPSFDVSPRIHVTILLEKEASDWTKGTIKGIMYDCEEIIKSDSKYERYKFKAFDKWECIMIQIFCIKEINDLCHITHGDL